MKVISTTMFRNNISDYMTSLLVDSTSAFVIGRRDKPEAVLISYPQYYNKNLSDSTNVAMFGGAYDFLKDEPDMYTIEDTLEWKAKHQK